MLCYRHTHFSQFYSCEYVIMAYTFVGLSTAVHALPGVHHGACIAERWSEKLKVFVVFSFINSLEA